MGLFGIFGWIFGLLFGFVFERIDDIFVWILPSYMTVYVIKGQKEEYYKNFLCFWALLALILGFEHVTLYLFYYVRLYRLCRLLFVVWLQLDYCNNSAFTLSKITPYISKEWEKWFEKGLDAVTKKIDKEGTKIQEKATNQFWSVVQQNYEIIKETVFKGLKTVSEKAGDLTHAANIDSKNIAGEQDMKEEKEKEKIKKVIKKGKKAKKASPEKPTIRKKES